LTAAAFSRRYKKSKRPLFRFRRDTKKIKAPDFGGFIYNVIIIPSYQ